MSASSDKPVGGSGEAGEKGGDVKETEESAFIPQTATGPPSKSRIAVLLVVIVFGLLLTCLGLVAYFAFAGGEGKDRSVTALIPLFWGLPIGACAVITLGADRSSKLTEDTRTKVRKHAMHIVAVLALLGVLAPLGRLIASGVKGGFVFNAAVGTQIAMCVLCALLLAVTVVNFIAIRRARRAAEEAEAGVQNEEK